MEEVIKSWAHKRDINGNVVEIIKTPKICFDYIDEDYMLSYDELKKSI